MKAVYTAHATATGGRDGGRSVSSDKALDVPMSMPKELGGAGGTGTNPEQLFAAGYASCFLSAMKLVGGGMKMALPDASSVHAAVGVGPNDKGGFGLSVKLAVSLPGLARDTAQAIVTKAHEVCPYSNATRGNIDVDVVLAD